MLLEEKLHGFFKEYDQKGFVIAINGEWGIGKTEFWKRFIADKYRTEYLHQRSSEKQIYLPKPYAYVSLFGVDSLQTLKMQIATSLGKYSEDKGHTGFNKKINKTLLTLKDSRFSFWGLNITSPKFFEEIIFSQVKNAIICIDDFERLSGSLKTKDIMGLINFLKVENRCQIVLIMHDDQLKDEEYKGYKEKVFDEILVIPSVLPLLEEMHYENERHKEIFLKFYKWLEVDNFRFYKKVYRLYSRFIKYIAREVPWYLDDLILGKVFLGVLISDLPQLGYTWENKNSYYYSFDSKKITDEELAHNKKRNKFIQFSQDVIYDKSWDSIFQYWLEGNVLDKKIVNDLIDVNLLSKDQEEKKNRVSKFSNLFWNLDIKDENFAINFYEAVKDAILLERLNNLDFYCYILELLSRADLSASLEAAVKASIEERFLKDPKEFSKNHLTNIESKNRFNNYIDELKKDNSYLMSSSLKKAIENYLNGSWSIDNKVAVCNSTKEQWKQLIFEDNVESDYFMNKSNLIDKCIAQQIDPSKNPEIKQWIIEILEEKYPDGSDFEGYRKFIISQLGTLS